MFRKKRKRLSIAAVELRQIVPSMVIAERKVWYTNVQQQPVTQKKYTLDWLKETLKNRGIMAMSNLLKTNFMVTVLPCQVIHGKWKKRKNVTPALTWEVLRTAKTYSNITKRCSLCLHKKLAITTYPYPDEFLNRWPELVTKCRHENKFLLKNFNRLKFLIKNFNSNNLRKFFYSETFVGN